MLAENIKKYRKKKGWSQEQLAKESGITYSTLIKIESGVNKNPTIQTLTKLASAFGVSVDNLIK
ncbi:MAG: helix-turn-helix domain-containing protein [Candidatus Omnitrophica bacterium]|nr:helix-turn-helix domain-containing protein [Candidatus Omnitrophota bacterium]